MSCLDNNNNHNDNLNCNHTVEWSGVVWREREESSGVVVEDRPGLSLSNITSDRGERTSQCDHTEHRERETERQVTTNN